MSISDDLRSSSELIHWEESHTTVTGSTTEGSLNLTILPPRNLYLEEPENGAEDPDPLLDTL